METNQKGSNFFCIDKGQSIIIGGRPVLNLMYQTQLLGLSLFCFLSQAPGERRINQLSTDDDLEGYSFKGNMLSKTEKRVEEKDLETHRRVWFGSSTTEYEMYQFFFSSALKKKVILQYEREFLGTSYLPLPGTAKRTLRQEKGQFNLQMLPSKPSLKILQLSKALIKKKKVTTDAICQPLQQILLYIKCNNVFEMQLFKNPKTVLSELSKSFFSCLS